MKATLTKLSLIILFFTVVFTLNAQENQTPEEKLKLEDNSFVSEQDEMTAKETKAKANIVGGTKELLLGLPKISEKTLFIISETSLKIKGLNYVGFCEGHKLGMFKYDQSVFKKPEDVIKAFEKENVFMPMYIKEGGFNDVEDICQTK
jgi:hypothetical protein